MKFETTVVWVHARTVSIEDWGSFDLDSMLPMVIKEQGFRAAFSLVITRTRTNWVDTAAIPLRLGMHRKVPVHF